MKKVSIFIFFALLLASSSCAQTSNQNEAMTDKQYPKSKSKEEWKKTLSPEVYNIMWEQGTERAFTGKYWDFKGDGVYKCASCGAPLFDSKTKFRSGSGWPSYWEAIHDGAVDIRLDKSFGMIREEVLCSQCGGHLGHRFNDGPPPTGFRYCINSASLQFEPRSGSESSQQE